MTAEDYPYAVQPPRPDAVLRPSPAGFDDRGEPLDPRIVTAAGWLMGILILLLFANAAFVPLVEMDLRRHFVELVVLALFGLILAQVAVIPAAMVFSPGPLILRTLICWSLAILLCGSWLAGYAISQWQRYSNWNQGQWDDIREIGWGIALWLPAALLAFQSPLWLLKLYFGWSLVRTDADGKTEPLARPLAISDYMLAMVMVGAALALARWHAASYSSTPEDYWIPVLMYGPAGMIACLLGAIPAMLLLLHFRDWRIGLAVLTVYCLTLSAIPLAARAAYLGHIDWIGWYEPLMFATPFLAWGAGLAACAGIVRVAGYRLQIGRRGANPFAPSPPPPLSPSS